MNIDIAFCGAGLIAAAVSFIGCSYLVSPERVSGSFGLKPPARDLYMSAWLRLKGIRDLAFGLLIITLMLTEDRRSVGIALLVTAIVPFGDMSTILGSGGSKSKAFTVHGVTCALIIFVALMLIRGH